jgi:coproporphyrinogen III oxidase-like Fe-S oxidoreductase
MGLRTIEGVPLAELAPLGLAPASIETMVGDGLLVCEAGSLIATRRGRAVLDRITLDLAVSADAG